MSMETIKTEYQSELALVEDAKQLSEFWAKYLGKGGQLQEGFVRDRRLALFLFIREQVGFSVLSPENHILHRVEGDQPLREHRVPE